MSEQTCFFKMKKLVTWPYHKHLSGQELFWGRKRSSDSATVPVACFFQANIGFMIYHDQIVPLTKLRNIVQRMLKNQLEQSFIRKHGWLSRVDCMKNLQNLPAQSRFGLLNCGEPWRVTCVLAAHVHDSWWSPPTCFRLQYGSSVAL